MGPDCIDMIILDEYHVISKVKLGDLLVKYGHI